MAILTTAAAYAAGARGRNRPAGVDELIVMNLVDWFSVVLGARHEPAGRKVAEVVAGWGMRGDAPLFTGTAARSAPHSAPVGAALVNGTLAHCLDYDDLHFPSLSHLSAPTWAAILALAPHVDADERLAMDAFSAGFEVSARLGSNGMGKAVTDRGWHSTGVHGRLSAAIASGVMLDLDADTMAHAIAVAATQTSGLTTSFGTMAKPFHAGKAAADGVLAAELAAAGFEGSLEILDAERNLARALVQDEVATMSLRGLGDDWEIQRNALKPYACCGLTHAAIDCARAVFPSLGGRRVERVDVQAHPLAPKVANHRAPETPLAGKFSLSYCVSLGLNGYRATEADFSDARLREADVQSVERAVDIAGVDDLEPLASRLQVVLADGETLSSEVAVSLGNPENPMSWSDLGDKFTPMARGAVGDRTDALFDSLRGFAQPGSLKRVLSLAA